MNRVVFFKLSTWTLAALLLAGCDNSGSGDPQDPERPRPDPGVTMNPGEEHQVSADDRLVTTSLEPARIKVVLELDEASGETQAQVTLLAGEADLFQ